MSRCGAISAAASASPAVSLALSRIGIWSPPSLPLAARPSGDDDSGDSGDVCTDGECGTGMFVGLIPSGWYSCGSTTLRRLMSDHEGLIH